MPSIIHSDFFIIRYQCIMQMFADTVSIIRMLVFTYPILRFKAIRDRIKSENREINDRDEGEPDSTIEHRWRALFCINQRENATPKAPYEATTS